MIVVAVKKVLAVWVEISNIADEKTDIMSYAEMAAHELYSTMHLDTVSDDVKRHLIILMLSDNQEYPVDETVIQIPTDCEDAMRLGAVDIECVREDLHSYADRLSEEYCLK